MLNPSLKAGVIKGMLLLSFSSELTFLTQITQLKLRNRLRVCNSIILQ
jgi:hypothetical protein